MTMYQLCGDMNGVIVSVNKYEDDLPVLCIPFDPANTDYAAYLEWVAQGGVPEPAPEPEPVPELTPAEKLAASGLTVEELKELLGI
jgi:hypothetical protein